jgi:hypothetical protein
MTGSDKKEITKLRSKVKTSRCITFSLLLSCISFLWFSILEAQEIYIISNASLQISFDDVKNAYLGKLSQLGGEKLMLLEPPIESPAKQKFLREVLGMDIQSYRKIWLTKLMAGENPPQVKSEDEIIKEVSEKKSAIGYVTKKVEDKSVRIITVLK